MKKWTQWMKEAPLGGKIWTVLLCLLVVVLLFSSVYFYNRSQESDITVQIGRPFENERDGNITTGVDFTNTDVIKDKETVDLLLGAFLHAQPAAPSEMTNRKADAALYLSNPFAYGEYGVTDVYYFWLEENFILFAPEYGDSDSYREMDEVVTPFVKAILEEQINRPTLVLGT